MLAYIKGELATKARGYVVIDVGGLGYKVFMSEIAMENIGKIGDIVKVHTYYRVMEDDISIFGFNTPEELRLFELPNTSKWSWSQNSNKYARSNWTIQILQYQIISNDINTLKKLPGIGPKTAQRIVLELKDKLKKEQQIEELSIAANSIGDKKIEIRKAIEKDSKEEEAFTALQVLGYTSREIEKARIRLIRKIWV